MPTPASEMPMPTIAVSDRQAHRDHRAERDEQHDDRGEDADDLARGHAASLNQLPGELDLHTPWLSGAASSFTSSRGLLRVRARSGRGRDRRDRRLAAGRDLDRLDVDDALHVADLGQVGVDRRAVLA